MSEPAKEPWTQWATLTVAVMAVFALISFLLAAGSGTRLEVAAGKGTGLVSRQHAHDLKEETYRMVRDLLTLDKLLEHKNARVQKFLETKVKEYEDKLARTEKERAQLKTDAEQAAQQVEKLRQQQDLQSRAVIFWLLALALAALGVYTRRKLPWLLGLALGAGGLFFLARGFFS